LGEGNEPGEYRAVKSASSLRDRGPLLSINETRPADPGGDVDSVRQDRAFSRHRYGEQVLERPEDARAMPDPGRRGIQERIRLLQVLDSAKEAVDLIIRGRPPALRARLRPLMPAAKAGKRAAK
jgi:hypothetical protein